MEKRAISPILPSTTGKNWRKAANLLTAVCLLTVFLLAVCFVLGPKTGIKSLFLIVPWGVAFLAHVILVLPTVFCTIKAPRSGHHLWIYIYFIFFRVLYNL